jgi:GH18 family chitinase
MDRVANIYYNGVETMTRKTQYVLDNDYSGIMIWELGQDVGSEADSISLLNAIHTTIYP